MSLARSAQLVITKKEEGTGRGPELILFRDSASPEINDILGYIGFNGKNSALESLEYAGMYALLNDPVNGTENGTLIIRTTLDNVQTAAATFREGGIDTPQLHGHTKVEKGFSMTGTAGTIGVDTRIAYTVADISIVARPIGAYSAGSIEGWALNNTAAASAVAGDVFAVDVHGRVSCNTGQYLSNMYYDGSVFRSRFAGFAGGLLYSTTTGSHTISGTAATTAANGTVTLRNMFSIDKDGNTDIMGALNLTGAGALGRVEYTNADMAFVGRQAAFYGTGSPAMLAFNSAGAASSAAADLFMIDDAGRALSITGQFYANTYYNGTRGGR